MSLHVLVMKHDNIPYARSRRRSLRQAHVNTSFVNDPMKSIHNNHSAMDHKSYFCIKYHTKDNRFGTSTILLHLN